MQNDTTTQSVSESPNKITSHKQKSSLCPSGNAVSVTLKTFNGKVEGGDIEGKHMGVRFSDQTVDRWCSHLADKWTTNARRNIDGQEEVKGTYRPLTEPVKQLNSNKSKQRMTQVVEVTMLANGVEEVLVTNKVTDPTTLLTPAQNWYLNGRSIDDILNNLDSLKKDRNLPMPSIEADPATLEDFLQYTKNLPPCEHLTTDLDEDNEKSIDADCPR